MANRLLIIHPFVAPAAGGVQPLPGHAHVDSLNVTLVDGAGVAVIGENVYVSDIGNHVILKGSAAPGGVVGPSAFDAIGQGNGFEVFVGAAGVSGDVDGPLGTNRLKAPGALTVDKSGFLWVIDTGNGKIKKIDQNGNCNTVVAVPTEADNSIAVDSQGRVFMTDNN